MSLALLVALPFALYYILWPRPRHPRQIINRLLGKHRRTAKALRAATDARRERNLSTPAELQYDKMREAWGDSAPTDRPVGVASTGCELTDQIFAAARAKGIMPVDVIGPAPVYENFD